MVDIPAVGVGAIGGVLAGKLGDKLEDAHASITGIEKEDVLKDILLLLEHWYIKYCNNIIPELEDVYTIVTVSKTSFGPPIFIAPKDRQYTQVLAGITTVLNVSSFIGPFNITIAPAKWTSLDIPENSTVTLDSSYANNTAQLYLRFTNTSPF